MIGSLPDFLDMPDHVLAKLISDLEFQVEVAHAFLIRARKERTQRRKYEIDRQLEEDDRVDNERPAPKPH